MKSHKIAHETTVNSFTAGALAALDPAGAAYATLPRPLVGWGGDTPSNFSPIDAIERCSWTFVGTCAGRKDGHPPTFEMAAPLTSKVRYSSPRVILISDKTAARAIRVIIHCTLEKRSQVK